MSGIGQMAHLTMATAGGAGTMDGSSAANAGASALAIKRRYPSSNDGIYWIKPPSGSAVQVFCDMTTDGGGWMLVARTHPNATIATPGTFGWRGPAIGSLSTFTNCYQLGIYALWQQGLQFYQFIFGNQNYNDNYSWGPFIYMIGLSGDAPAGLFNNNNIMSGNNIAVLKSDSSIYTPAATFPGMQYYYGFATTATGYDNYFLRDCCTPGPGGYGINPTGMTTAYCNDTSHPTLPGAWCAGASLGGPFGNQYVQGGSTSPTNQGGTNQCMLMVR